MNRAEAAAGAGLDPSRHYVVLRSATPVANAVKMIVMCGSGADVAISRPLGVILQLVDEDDAIPIDANAPLIVECAKHGTYLAFLRMLPRSSTDEPDTPVAMPLMLIPAGAVEHADPFDMARRVAP